MTDLRLPPEQAHLLAFADQLADAGRRALTRQLAAIDFEQLARLFGRGETHDAIRDLADRAQSPPGIRLGADDNPIVCADAIRAGEEALRGGRVGVLLVAGGQGTRLGFDHPKGMYPIGPISGRSLFQIFVEKIRASSRRYGRPIPLYVMTSAATDEETREFFARHERFGLPAEDLFFFQQGTMPAVDAATGRLLLDEPGHVFESPDGHGGMLQAIARSGGLAQMRRRGVHHLFYFQVDNPLVDVAGAEFLGYHILSGSEMTTQVVAKQDPLERVGNVVRVDGVLRVIEYSDLPDDVARRRAADGSLAIWAGSIAVHAMETAFLERMAQSHDGLPFHRAMKKVPYIDGQGRRVEPERPNAVKFERFIFDLLPSARNAIVVEVDPAKAFAPLKNAPGAATDSPERVQAQMVDFYRSWLEGAGAQVAGNVQVEVSPLFAMDENELREKIPPGTRVSENKYFV